MSGETRASDPVESDPVRSGRAALERGQPALAYHEFMRGVMRDDAEARYWLGTLLLRGEGIRENRAGAAKLYGEAAAKKFPPAMRDYGLMQLAGIAVPQNKVAGLELLRAAADAFDYIAMDNLGDVYFRGEHVPKDRVEALKWYNLAYGNAAAQKAEDAADFKTKFETLARSMPQTERRDALRRVEDFFAKRKP